MKLSGVSFLLAVLAACDLPTEPPPPAIPRAPDEIGPIVIVGRVVHGPKAVGLQATQVRVTEAGVGVFTDEKGRYRIVLPARFRGQTVSVQFRAIGFSAASRMVAIASNSTTVDMGMTESMIMLGCTMGIIDTAVPRRHP
jgi:hypothetical protein